MFCSECGVKAGGKFCWSCGGALQRPAGCEDLPAPIDWTVVTDYQAIVRIPEVRERIARHAAMSKKRMSGEQFLDVCEKLFSPLTGGVPLASIATFAQPLYAKLGLKTGKSHSERFDEPPGKVIVAVLCSLAQGGQELRKAISAADGCVIEASLPSDICSLNGELTVVVRPDGAGTIVDAAATIKGQLYDWGKSRRALEHLFHDVTVHSKAA